MANPYAHLKATSAGGSFSARVDLPRLTSTMPGHGSRVLFSTLVATLGLTIYQELGCPRHLDQVQFTSEGALTELSSILEKIAKDGLRTELALGLVFAVSTFPELARSPIFTDPGSGRSLGAWIYQGPEDWGQYLPFYRKY